MKKVLLLAAVAFGFNAMGQDAASARLMQAELPVSTAAKEKIEDIMLKRGGAVDDLYDYTDFLYQYYSSDMTLGAITTTPDSSTVIVYSDGSTGNSYNHAVGATYDFNYYGWGDNEFDEGDQVTIDSLFVIGGYDIFNGNNSDKIRFTILKVPMASQRHSQVYSTMRLLSLHLTQQFSLQQKQWIMLVILMVELQAA